MIHPVEVKPVRVWVERLMYAVLIGMVTITLLIMLSLVWDAYLNAPPVSLKSLDPAHLGILCPGDRADIHNEVTIADQVIIHYFASTLDENGWANVPGTQQAFTDYLHPYPAKFTHRMPWHVPDLPPGDYTRTFAVRKVSGNEDTVFVLTSFTVGTGCKGGSAQ